MGAAPPIAPAGVSPSSSSHRALQFPVKSMKEFHHPKVASWVRLEDVMLSETHLSPKDTFHLEEVPAVVSFAGTESGMGMGRGGKGVGVSGGQRVDGGHRGRGRATKVQFGKMESSGGRGRGWLCKVIVLQTTELRSSQ